MQPVNLLLFGLSATPPLASFSRSMVESERRFATNESSDLVERIDDVDEERV